MEQGKMHIASTDPSVSGLSYAGKSYPAVPGTTHVFEVDTEVGEHLVKFPHWRVPLAQDFSENPWPELAGAQVRPDFVPGRRSGTRPLSDDDLAEVKAQVRAELLAELRQAGVLVGAALESPVAPPKVSEPVPAPEEPEDDEEPEEDEDEAEEEVPAPAPVRRPASKSAARRR